MVNLNESEILLINNDIECSAAYMGEIQVYPNGKFENVTVSVTSAYNSIKQSNVNIRQLKQYKDTPYYLLDYIECTGKQYINTGVKPNLDTRILTDIYIYPDGVNNYVFGSRAAASSLTFAFLVTTANRYRSAYNTSNTLLAESYTKTERFLLDKNKNITYFDGTKITTATYTTWTGDYEMYIGAINTKGSINYGRAKFYSFLIYDNGTLVRDYIPVISQDSIPGFYDCVNNTFNPSIGSSDFIAGYPTDAEIISQQTELVKTHKLPQNCMYYVELAEITNYTSPSNTPWFAKLKERSIDVAYREHGVFIQDINSKIWLTEDWDGSVEANCVAVFDEECAVGVYYRNISCNKFDDFGFYFERTYNSSAEDYEFRFYYGKTAAEYKTLYGLSDYTTRDEAILDFDGKLNTLKLLSVITNKDSAVLICYNTVFPNGKHGYLPSCGELDVCTRNGTAVSATRKLIGGHRYYEGDYYSSTVHYYTVRDNVYEDPPVYIWIPGEIDDWGTLYGSYRSFNLTTYDKEYNELDNFNRSALACTQYPFWGWVSKEIDGKIYEAGFNPSMLLVIPFCEL